MHRGTSAKPRFRALAGGALKRIFFKDVVRRVGFQMVAMSAHNPIRAPAGHVAALSKGEEVGGIVHKNFSELVR
jgi:hypothetical protein